MSRPLDLEKEQKIASTAIACFGEQGFAGTTMKDIADKAGLSPGTIYTYFADKERLFVRCVEEVWQSFYRDVESITKSTDGFFNKIIALSDYGMDVLKRLHPLVRGMYEQANRLDLISTNIEKLSNQIAMLFEGVYDNEARDVFSLSRMAYKLRPYVLKIWISGILFTLSSAKKEQVDSEILIFKELVRESLHADGYKPTEKT